MGLWDCAPIPKDWQQVRRGSKRQEWRCACGVTNFLDRPQCRSCAAREPKQSPPTGKQHDGSPQQSQSQAQKHPMEPQLQNSSGNAVIPKAPRLAARIERLYNTHGATWLGQALSGWKRGVVDGWPCRKPSADPSIPSAAATPALGAVPPVTAAPWARAQAAAERAKALTVALNAVKGADGCAGVAAQLEAELAAAQKAAVDARPLTARIEGCRKWIAGAEKRAAAAEQAVKAALEQKDAIDKDLAEHRARLAAFECEGAAAAAEWSAPAAAEEMTQLRAKLVAVTAERDALRTAQGPACPSSPAARPPAAAVSPRSRAAGSSLGAHDEDAVMSGEEARQQERGRSPAVTPVRSRLRAESAPPLQLPAVGDGGYTADVAAAAAAPLSVPAPPAASAAPPRPVHTFFDEEGLHQTSCHPAT
eukprot:gene60-10265_t